MNEIIIPFYNELGQLIEDYYRGDDLIVKGQIQFDIVLLTDAILACFQSG
ncbi:hypothetical protein [Peribacillus sp. R9-11]|nr:hypothetical protein [Peribacillus sp. R9-11]WMX58770.1 hypothetical protein RE409_28430 [Peribacillus sp. R9-11]